MRLLFLSLLLAIVSAPTRADGVETITATNVQLGQDQLYFTIQLDTTTNTVIAGSINFGVSGVELPWYDWTYSGSNLNFALFDSLDYWFGGVPAGSYIDMSFGANPTLANITTYCGEAQCNGLAPGYGSASAGTITMNGEPVSTPEPSSIEFMAIGLLIFFTALLLLRPKN